MSPYPLSAEVWPLAWFERRRQRSVDRGDIAPIADCSIRSVWVVPAGCVEPSCMFTSHPHAAEVGCLPVRLSVRCRIPTVAFDFGSCAPSSPIRKIAESHVDLAACCQHAGHAFAVAVVTASSTPCPLPTRQALRATALIGVGGRAIACPGRGSLHCQITATHGHSQVTLGRGGLGQQRSTGPAARQFGLGRCRPGTGGQHDDQHEQVSDQAHDGLRGRPERGASPSGVGGRQTTFAPGRWCDLTATLRLLADSAEAGKSFGRQQHAHQQDIVM